MGISHVRLILGKTDRLSGRKKKVFTFSSFPKYPDPSKLAILRALHLLYRFKPFYWRVQWSLRLHLKAKKRSTQRVILVLFGNIYVYGWHSKNRGIYPPKWMVNIVEKPIKTGWFGGKPSIFGNIHISAISIWEGHPKNACKFFACQKTAWCLGLENGAHLLVLLLMYWIPNHHHLGCTKPVVNDGISTTIPSTGCLGFLLFTVWCELLANLSWMNGTDKCSANRSS